MDTTSNLPSGRKERRIAFLKPRSNHDVKVAHAMQLFSSMLWAFKGTTRSAWEIAAPEDADVIVFHGDDPDRRIGGWQANGKLTVEIATGPVLSGYASRALVYPFRAAQAFALLEQLDAEMYSAGALSEASVNHTNDLAGVSGGEDPWSFVEALRGLRMHSGPDTWQAACKGSQPLLWVKLGGSLYRAEPSTIEDFRRGAFRLCELRMRSGLAAPEGLQTGAEAELSWFAGYFASERLAVSLSESVRYRIARWPNFGVIHPPASQIRITALLADRAVTLGEVISLARVSNVDAARTLNALAVQGLLVPGEGEHDVSSHRLELAAAPSALGSLLRKIRRHLGMGARA